MVRPDIDMAIRLYLLSNGLKTKIQVRQRIFLCVEHRRFEPVIGTK